DRAEAAGAPLVVIRIDTPGGLDTSMRQIIDRILRARMPVAVWVGPSGARAASAGFVITIIADVAAMAPGTNIGAAHPVSGLGSVDETMAKKMASDAAAYVRGKAERRGRNVELAEKAVLESRSFTEREALEGKLIDLIVPDVPALLRALALVLFAAEVKVPSFGLLTAGGIASIILGAMMLVDAPEAEMRVSLGTLLPAAGVVAVGTMLLVRLVLQARRRPPLTGAS